MKVKIKEENNFSKEDVQKLKESLKLFSDVSDDSMQLLSVLIETPDDTFEVLAPGILDSYLRSLNTTNYRMIMAQTLNSTGIKADDFVNEIQKAIMQIDTLESITTPKKTFLKKVLLGLINVIEETEGISKRVIQIPFEKCHPDAKMPKYAHVGDSGMDVFALDDYTIMPGETKLIPTGIKMQIPAGYEIQVRAKSGRALKTKLRIANQPGSIDSCFRGEIAVIMENIEPPIKDITYDFDGEGRPVITSILHGSPYYIQKGEKFAQLVLMEVPKASLVQVEKVDETDRNEGAFGSTGLK